MAKVIYPHELAQIVSGLLISPELFGELDSPEQYSEFMQDIGEVIANHCGGEISGVEASALPEYRITNDNEEETQPALFVRSNDSLPSIDNNVWSAFDPEAWMGEQVLSQKIEHSKQLTAAKNFKGQLNEALASTLLASQGYLEVSFSLQDWRASSEVDDLDELGDDEIYTGRLLIASDVSLELKNEKGETKLESSVEINKGVPALHLGVNGSEMLTHIHAAQGGLVFTPDADDVAVSKANFDRHTYYDKRSIRFKPINDE